MKPLKWWLLGIGITAMLLTAAHKRANSPALMSETAGNFLKSLTPEQLAKAKFPFEGEERYFWHYIPSDDIPKRFGRPRNGVPIRDMTPAQRHLAQALLSAGLSQRGHVKVSSIMSLEDVLRVLEKDSGERRNPEKYFFSIFGEPAEKGTWGYRVEGHHVSLHFTVVDGKVVGSPTFLGANPAEVREGPRKGLRVLSAEEDLGRAILESLDAAQKKVAIVSDTAYPDILTEASRKAALKGQPSGLSAAKFTPKQKALLTDLLSEYAENLPEDMAEARLNRIKQAGNNLFFAWAGVAERGGPHYYRVQGPTFLIEYDNTQNKANHIHSVWRDFDGDWGQDLLSQHYKSSADHKR